jgi:hypothetical protein
MKDEWIFVVMFALIVLPLSAAVVWGQAPPPPPCYSDKPENCPTPRSEAPVPRIIYGPTVIVPDDGELHPYIHVPDMGSCQSVGAICQKTA